VTYSTNPVIPKRYVKWSRRKVLSKYSNMYPSCRRTFIWKHLLQENFVWSLVRISTMSALRLSTRNCDVVNGIGKLGTLLPCPECRAERASGTPDVPEELSFDICEVCEVLQNLAYTTATLWLNRDGSGNCHSLGRQDRECLFAARYRTCMCTIINHIEIDVPLDWGV
jgi:hypothetical protein